MNSNLAERYARTFKSDPKALIRVPMAEVRARYAEANPNGHWFDADTIAFFQTVLPCEAMLAADGSFWFITRETDPANRKRYSVRRLAADGRSVSTLGRFHTHPTRRDAYLAMRAAAQGGGT